MTHTFTFGRGVALAALLLIVGSIPALAIPVAAPFGSDSMPKALFFTGAARPATASGLNGRGLETLRTGGVSAATASPGNGLESGVIMTPVGDGSYVCTVAVYPGSSFTYFFGKRIHQWDIAGAGLDSVTTWTVWRNDNEPRTVLDVGTARTIMIPLTATSGYYIYNAFGDRTVIGFQGADTTVMTTANPFLARFGGTDTIGGVNAPGNTFARISTTTGDTRFANNDFNYSPPGNFEGRVRGVTVTQTGPLQFLVNWQHGMSGATAAGFMPTVDGAVHFGTQNPGAAGSVGRSQMYGYRILRGDSRGVYIDVTQSVTGDTNWSSHDWNGNHSFTDTSVTGLVGDTFYYTVVWSNAYGYGLDSTIALAPQLALGKGVGFDTGRIGLPIRVFFIVEHLKENVVFPNGEDHGRMFLTPYIDGVRRPELRFPADVTRTVIRPSTV